MPPMVPLAVRAAPRVPGMRAGRRTRSMLAPAAELARQVVTARHAQQGRDPPVSAAAVLSRQIDEPARGSPRPAVHKGLQRRGPETPDESSIADHRFRYIDRRPRDALTGIVIHTRPVGP